MSIVYSSPFGEKTWTDVRRKMNRFRPKEFLSTFQSYHAYWEINHGSLKLSRDSFDISFCHRKGVTTRLLSQPLLTIHRVRTRLSSWMKKAGLSAIMCEGVLLLQMQWSHAPASLPHSHIVLALKASCHACLITGTHTHAHTKDTLKLHSLGSTRAVNYISALWKCWSYIPSPLTWNSR